jgi:hypothetical protein
VSEFRKYPSIPRYRKDIQVTEKIDGTNAAIIILNEQQMQEAGTNVDHVPSDELYVNEAGSLLHVVAQSRSKLIYPGKQTDNHGFAGWVREHKDELASLLGDGYHYGEWWGSGINRGYGLKNGEKRFSLFNPDRYKYLRRPNYENDLLSTVPVLYQGPAYLPYTPADSQTRDAVEYAMQKLRETGSRAAEGYDNPEGVVVFHTASRSLYKVTYEYDEGKWAAAKS